jgi:hypothetical protein
MTSALSALSRPSSSTSSPTVRRSVVSNIGLRILQRFKVHGSGFTVRVHGSGFLGEP